MASPFPGMDPYLESPDIWPHVHDSLAGEISSMLNATLPAPYYARLEMRPEVGVIEQTDPPRRIVPDVAVVERAHGQAVRTAVADTPRVELSHSYEVAFASESIRHHLVEIRDPARGHKLVTLIEIVSPANKQPGPDRKSYLRKQYEILGSDASLIEIDLLRGGTRLLADVQLEKFLDNLEPPPDYLVSVNRAWRRAEPAFQLFPFTLREPLPCIPVPLREGQEEIKLDLQYVFQRVYDGGPYRRGAVDYTKAPQPPLAETDQAWANSLLTTARNGG